MNGRPRGHFMKRIPFAETGLTLALSLLLAGCGSKSAPDPKAEAPPPAQVEQEADASKKRRAFLLLVPHFREFPDLARHAPVLRRMGVHQLHHVAMGRRDIGREHQRRTDRHGVRMLLGDEHLAWAQHAPKAGAWCRRGSGMIHCRSKER